MKQLPLLFFSLVIALLLVAVTPSRSADKPAVIPASEIMFVLCGQQVATCVPAAGYSAERRIWIWDERLTEACRTGHDAETVTVKAGVVLLHGAPIMSVTDADLKRDAPATADEIARIWARNLHDALLKWKD